MTIEGEDQKRVARFLQEIAESEHPLRAYNRGCLELIAGACGMTVDRDAAGYRVTDPGYRVTDPEAEPEAEAARGQKSAKKGR